MIIHIVRANESLKAILDHYHVLKEELMGENKHITDFNHLRPGTKIKIPLITPEVIEVLEETEPFIEDYYQKNEVNNEAKEEIKEETNKESEEPKTEEKKTDSKNPRYPNRPHYYYGYRKI